MISVNVYDLVKGKKYLHYKMEYKGVDAQGKEASEKLLCVFVHEWRDMAFPIVSIKSWKKYSVDPFTLKEGRSYLVLSPYSEYFELTDEEFLYHTVAESI